MLILLTPYNPADFWDDFKDVCYYNKKEYSFWLNIKSSELDVLVSDLAYK